MIRLIQIVPREEARLCGLIVRKERDLANRNRGAFFRSAAKTKDRAK
jgi:hypothetical protein